MKQIFDYIDGEPVFARVQRIAEGQFQAVPAVLDYIHRPADLDQVCLYEFCARFQTVRATNSRRPPRGALPLQPEHPKSGFLFVRKRDRQVVPLVIGPRIQDRVQLHLQREITGEPGSVTRASADAPFADEETQSDPKLELYARTALVLHRPWRAASDLRPENGTYVETCAAWTPPLLAQRHLQNCQAYHDGRRSAAEVQALRESHIDLPPEVRRSADANGPPTGASEDEGEQDLDCTSLLRAAAVTSGAKPADVRQAHLLRGSGWTAACGAPPLSCDTTRPEVTTPLQETWRSLVSEANSRRVDAGAAASDLPVGDGGAAQAQAADAAADGAAVPEPGRGWPIVIEPFARAIEDRLLREDHDRGTGEAPTSASVAASYAALGHPPTIKEASDICRMTPMQHVQFSLLALVVLREGVRRNQLREAAEGATADWDAVADMIDAAAGGQQTCLLSQGVAGAGEMARNATSSVLLPAGRHPRDHMRLLTLACGPPAASPIVRPEGKTYGLTQLYHFAVAWGLEDAILYTAPTGTLLRLPDTCTAGATPL